MEKRQSSHLSIQPRGQPQRPAVGSGPPGLSGEHEFTETFGRYYLGIRTSQRELVFSLLNPGHSYVPLPLWCLLFAPSGPRGAATRAQGSLFTGGLVLLCHMPCGYCCCVLGAWAGVAVVAAPALPCSRGPHPLGPTLTLLPLPAWVSDIWHLPGEDPDLRHRGREGRPPLLRSSGERAELSHMEARALHVHFTSSGSEVAAPPEPAPSSASAWRDL